MVEIAAIAGCVVLACMALFQIALITGAPIGEYAWGGSHDVLPGNLRVGSGISILLYLLFAVILLGKAGLMPVPASVGVVSVAAWVTAVYFCVGVVMNGISRSKRERNVMTPVALVLAVCSLIVAAN